MATHAVGGTGDKYVVFRRPWTRIKRVFGFQGGSSDIVCNPGTFVLTGFAVNDVASSLTTKYATSKTQVAISRNPFTVFRKGWRRVHRGYSYENVTSVTTTLQVASGSFALTGFAATFAVTEAANVSSFGETGNTANFSIVEVTSRGSFTETGNAAPLDIELVAAFASFALTAFNISFNRTKSAWIPARKYSNKEFEDFLRRQRQFGRAVWEEWQAAYEAEKLAKERAEALREERDRQKAIALEEAAEAAKDALLQARLSQLFDQRQLNALTDALAGAAQINATLAHMHNARVQAAAFRAHLDELEREDEEEAIALLLL